MSALLFGLSWCFLAWAVCVSGLILHDLVVMREPRYAPSVWRIYLVGLLYGVSGACWWAFVSSAGV